ncbi:MAG TPA: DUF1127 domain-containing protein [Acidisoma sp.]|jgi:uncharacterized protein YjiS (DUF1127 family)|uniref:DUF1127 domain-containing protein n=1 Tax=Acidisoma sp. TaxID=1872115 RepID=UPI002C210CCF|nr:DUF1127 domain-containing protein [Acidisoma sp.]HTI00018.1 DUF1127 domain-containing protein [Acidisoma sp.]
MSLAIDTRALSTEARRAPTRLWRRLATAYVAATRRAALRRELDRMDAHMLADIGVSRAQLRFELEEAGRRGR